MAHVHFDLDEVARKMRKMRDDAIPVILASARSDVTRDGYIAQDRFFETSISAQGVRTVTRRIPIAFRGTAVERAQLPTWTFVDRPEGSA